MTRRFHRHVIVTTVNTRMPSRTGTRCMLRMANDDIGGRVNRELEHDTVDDELLTACNASNIDCWLDRLHVVGQILLVDYDLPILKGSEREVTPHHRQLVTTRLFITKRSVDVLVGYCTHALLKLLVEIALVIVLLVLVLAVVVLLLLVLVVVLLVVLVVVLVVVVVLLVA
jgi:hypothetical protein